MTDEELIAQLRKDAAYWSDTDPYQAGRYRQASDRIEALTAEKEGLKELLKRNIDDEPCRLDHHGYCQAHYLEEDCSVAAALAALEKQPVVRKARYFNRYLTDAEVDEQVAQMRSEK